MKRRQNEQKAGGQIKTEAELRISRYWYFEKETLK